MDASALQRAADSLSAEPGLRSLLVARHGRLALERYYGGADAATLFDARSAAKSVVGLLTGVLIRDGDLNGTDVSIAGALVPPYRLDGADSLVTVESLLTMTSGFAWEEETDWLPWLGSANPVQGFLDRRHAHPPDSVFDYDGAAVHLLSVVLARAAGRDLETLVVDRLLDPIGAGNITWERLADGSVNGAAGLALSARNLARLGQLALQDGWSADRDVVPEAWVREATRPHGPWRTSYGQVDGVGYGYLWWTLDGSPAAFLAWGFGGQFILVAPSLDLVVVTTTDWEGLDYSAGDALGVRILGLLVRQVVPAVTPKE